MNKMETELNKPSINLTNKNRKKKKKQFTPPSIIDKNQLEIQKMDQKFKELINDPNIIQF